MKLIAHPTCIRLKQYLNPGGGEAVDPPGDVPTGEEFLKKFLDRKHKEEVWECIMGVFDNLSAAHSYLSLVTTNMLSLVKIANEETFNMVLKASIQPMVQLNVPEKYLKLMEDPKLKSSITARLEKLRKVLLPNADRACITQEPQNNLTSLVSGPSSCPTCCLARPTSVD